VIKKEYHIALYTDLKEQAKHNPTFISNIITGDESWVYGYDLETKQQVVSEEGSNFTTT
jgi:hypothetical protein